MMALVVVQRGHVPRTSGATGAPGEQQFAIDTAALLAPMLRGMGHTVRVIDADEPRDRYRGDMFVAIHYDSSTSSSATGASVGYQNDAGARFAAAWKRAYVAEGWSRGFRGDNYSANLGQYYGVREAIAAGNHKAIITESGFHSNPGDDALMAPDRTARSIARAVGEITGTQPPGEDDDMPYSEEQLKEIIRAAVFNKEIPNPSDIGGRTATLMTWLRYRLARRADLTRVETKLDRLIAALGEHDAGLGDRLRAALADSTVHVDVTVSDNTGQEEQA